MKTKILITIFVLTILTAFFINNSNKDIIVKVNNTKYKTIVVNNDSSRTKGLSGRKSLPPDTVMLFVFYTSDKYGIWMKDMNFPIDIIWLDENKKIVKIKENVSPNTFPETFFPPTPSLYIIEANAGFVDENSLLVGNSINL